MSFGISGPSTQTQSVDELVNQLFRQSTTQQGTTTGTGTTTQQQTGVTTGQTAGETQRVLSPEQQAAQPQLFKIISQLATNPQQFLAPAQHQAREQVNENYGGFADSLRQKFLTGGGGGESGKYGRAAVMADLARRGDLSSVDNEFATRSAMLPVTAAQLAQQFLGLNFGEKTAGRTDASSTGGTTATTTSTENTDSSVNTTGQTVTDRQQQGKSRKGWGFGVGF